MRTRTGGSAIALSAEDERDRRLRGGFALPSLRIRAIVMLLPHARKARQMTQDARRYVSGTRKNPPHLPDSPASPRRGLRGILEWQCMYLRHTRTRLALAWPRSEAEHARRPSCAS
jgi:hypothetical protein